MSTYQNQNQFAQTPVLGQVDMTSAVNIKSVRINPASSSTVLTAGQFLKIVDVAGTEIVVDEAAVTEKSYGCIVYNPRKNTYLKGDIVEIACKGTVVYLEASAAIARGAKVQNTPAAPTVQTLASLATNCQVGICLDKPTGAAELARVEIDPQAANLSAY